MDTIEGEHLLDEEDPRGRDATGAEQVAAALNNGDYSWQSGEVLDVGDVRWQPHLWQPDTGRALHIHLSSVLPGYIARRLRAAKQAGFTIDVALPLDSLYDAETLELLVDLDSHVYIYDLPDTVSPRRHCLATLADQDIPVEPAVRTTLARRCLSLISEGTSQEKGKRLEALLAFLLGQTADFRVIERNYRTATQEIDIVVQIVHYSHRCWVTPGVPFVLVEAKNRQDTAGYPEVSLLIRKVQTKRGRSRIGMLFSLGGITGDAKDEELRISEGDLCIVMFDRSELELWIDAPNADDHLEEHVRRAMLR
jgi:Holliday junction resolvase-like predicted endonuclease